MILDILNFLGLDWLDSVNKPFSKECQPAGVTLYCDLPGLTMMHKWSIVYRPPGIYQELVEFLSFSPVFPIIDKAGCYIILPLQTQSGPLSLVQDNRGLVDVMMLLGQLSYAIKNQLKASKMPPTCAFRWFFMAQESCSEELLAPHHTTSWADICNIYCVVQSSVFT